MAKVLLLLLVCVALVTSDATSCEEYGVGDVSECTDGFPTLLRIEKLAETDNTELETRDRRQVVIPGINFACNGSITSVVVGAEWKDSHAAYTELQIWRSNSTGVYVKIDGASITANQKNNSEVYEITLDPPLAFQDGDILGYFQPNNRNCPLNLYLEESGRIITCYTAVGRNDGDPPATGAPFNLSDSNTEEDTSYPLIAVRTDPPDCGCGFMSVERVYALLQMGSRKNFDNRQMIFPNITFTCSGEVVKWIMTARWRNDRSAYPQLQIWRLMEGSTYKKIHSTDLSTDEQNDDVYEFPVNPPLPFQPGDILGVLQPNDRQSRLQVRYDDGEDAVSYYYTGADYDSDTFTIIGASVDMALPLITVEIVEHTSSPSLPTSQPTPTASVLHSIISSDESRAVPSKSQPITSISVTNDSPIGLHTTQSNPLGVGSTQNDGSNKISSTSVVDIAQSPTIEVSTGDNKSRGSAAGLSSGAIVGVVFTVIIVLLLVAISATVIMLRTRKWKTFVLNKHNKESGIVNPNYGDVTASEGTKYTNSIEMYTYANPHDDMDLYALPDTDDMDLYALPDKVQHYETRTTNPQETSQEWGIYVPTIHQRELYQEVDEIYSYPELKPVVSDGGGSAGAVREEESFFTESDVYWVPASSSAELYEQLSKYRYREIQRSQIETKEHLGAGQFGTVNKGVWVCPSGQRDVAIKVLQPGAQEDSRVTFLKEAAIMGQFSHPSVISLLGVVTLGEPVMIVMELMPDGNLRGNLIKMKPTPGEMAPDSLNQQLLDFCHQISAGMTYLSEKAFVHRDIAARNILVCGRTCKISDFGMARDLVDSDYYTSHGGQIPVKWTAPEALHYKKYSTASDVWSFGCLMYEIWSLGHKPFEDYTNAQVVRMVMTGWRLPPPPGCPREMYRLMICC